MAKNELGTTGLGSFNGLVQDDFLKELRGKQGYKNYDEMRKNSPIIGAMLYYHEQAIRKVSWNFVNKEDLQMQDERVDFLNDCKEYMTQSWNDFISEVLTFLPFGFSLFWINYKKIEGGWGWDSFSPRRQNTIYQWIMNYQGNKGYNSNRRNGEIMGVIQQAPPTFELVEMPIDRMLHFRTRVEANNPEGVSLLRNAFTSYYQWKGYRSLEGIGFERDLTGMPVLKMPQGASLDLDDPNSDAYKASEVLRNLRNDEQAGLLLPFGWDAQLLSGAGKGFAAINTAIEREENRQLMSLLSQFLMLGQNGVGSLALSQDSSSIAEMMVDATADIIAETFTKQAIPPLLAMNGWDSDGICLEHTPAGDTDVSTLADFLQKVGDKLTWSAKDELYLRQTAKLPEPSIKELEEARMKQDAVRRAVSIQLPTQQRPLMEDEQDVEDEEPIQTPQQNTISLFGIGDPIDKRKRRQAEKAWNDALTVFLQKQKKRVIKAAKQMKGE